MVFTIGIIGLGDIALRRHVPVIQRNTDFRLTATASQRGVTVDGVPHGFRDYQEMLQLADALCHSATGFAGGQAYPARKALDHDAG